MKLKREFYKPEILKSLGFGIVEPGLDEIDLLFGVEPDCEIDFEIDKRYSFSLGHSRRGQQYFITIEPETLEIFVYANLPDGRGTHVKMGNKIFEMIEKGMIERS